MSVFRLLARRSFAPFFGTQLLGAANDNIFKFAFTLLVTYQASSYSTLSTGLLVNLISGLFILPFLLFSATSGQLSDKYDKTTIMRGVKLAELGILSLACVGFWMHSAAVLLLCTFLMGVHSTVFGPAKYAYLPQHLEPQDIVAGNGLVEMGTFVAILAGTIAGGLLVDSGSPLALTATLLGLSVLGIALSWKMPPTPASDPGLAINPNPLSETWRNLAIARQTRSVFLSMLGISWLWFFGAVFLTQFAPFAKDVLHANAQVVTLLLAVFSIGIASGSLLCEKMSGHAVEIGLVPFGSIGMTLFGLDLWWSSTSVQAVAPATVHTIATFLQQASNWRVLVDLFGMAVFAGLYSVPLYAMIQTRCQASHRSRIIAANNILNALFMIASAVVSVVVLSVLQWSIPSLFLVVALLNLAVAVYIYSLVPEFLIRFAAWVLIHTVYRLKKINTTSIPAEGAALLICNHVSYADAVVLMAVSPRPIRFVMHAHIFKTPLLGVLFRHAKAIPIASAKADPAQLQAAYDAVDAALADGELVCIFPEGRISDTGQLYPFKSGVATILARRSVPVYPMALRGLWGSFFSLFGGRAFNWKNMGFARRIEVEVGPIAQSTDPALLQEDVQALLNNTVSSER